MSSEHLWRIHLKNIETHRSIGIYDFERKPQRVLVNATIEGMYPAHPQSIEDCVNYEYLYKLVAKEWPSRPHTALLETCVTELLEFIFSSDGRVTYARVSVTKPDIFPEAEGVGVEAEWTREDFKRYSPR